MLRPIPMSVARSLTLDQAIQGSLVKQHFQEILFASEAIAHIKLGRIGTGVAYAGFTITSS
ncbi:hypothetical protein COCCADRAFT_10616 [Bipolaris zeicola 26-R-13]|uniref:Uncharacterized protein n=1 Tax=Cochliobolus carbonum (strain 26-R-13) TaxID=930089 RepID=W6XM34_COCC2|nr:uncharacterized protein COCCADRAFT_10616 [Bipolaris zeicola 26-R-13]EUC26618.1 hypothetical protein COCCADRAFT_10616 [Bipolaris zeicola 26-R-13]